MDLIECPVCNTKVSKEKIEKHVDNCLKYPKEKPTTRRASTSPSNLGSFFSKKSKRKRPSSPKDTMKKLCVDNCASSNNNDDDTTVISDSPPFPLVDTECSKVDPDKISIPSPPSHPEGSFQNTLFKWSKINGASSSISEKKLGSVANETKANAIINGFKNTKIEMTKEDKIKEKVDHTQAQHKKQKNIQLGKTPLADQMRPTNFDNYFGQDAVSSSKVLRDLFYNKIIPSLLFWGPPGCGKVL